MKKAPPKRRKVSKKETPKKLTARPLTQRIANLPGKSSSKNLPGKSSSKKNKSFSCKTIADTPKDKNLKKKNGMLKGAWIACSTPGCSTLAHVL